MNGKTFLGWVINGDFTPDQANALQADADIVEEIMYERLRQFEKWGDQSGRKQHELLAILVEEVGEVAKGINDLTYSDLTAPEYVDMLKNLRNEWLQVAAVATQGVGAMDVLLKKMGVE